MKTQKFKILSLRMALLTILLSGLSMQNIYACNLQIFLCLFLEKLNMPQNTPVTKVS